MESPASEESDFVDDSNSDIAILVSDSDVEVSIKKQSYPAVENKEHVSDFVISSSEEDGDDSRAKSSNIIVSPKSLSVSTFSNSSSVNSSPILCVKNNRKILDSDEETSLTKIKSCIRIESDSQSDEESISFTHCSPFQNGNIHSSTRVSEKDQSLSTCNNQNLNNISDYNRLNSQTRNTSSSSLKTQQILPVIDLTQLNDHSNKNQFRDVIEDISSDTSDSGNENIELIDSDAEESVSKSRSSFNDSDHINLSHQLSTVKISPPPSKEDHSKTNKSSDTKINCHESNDYLSRTESLKAEEIRLKQQVSEVLRNLETTKTTLKTAVLSALPDKGVRLQMFLKKQESQLRDLRYQQSTLANEILKLQCTSQDKRQVKEPTAQKMFKLPTMNTDLNAMGKKAMETHKTQQALTVDALRQLHSSLKSCPNEDTFVSDPRGLLVELMLHQKQGLAWLLWREKEKPSGGILADDMGLGKTLTMIALILKTDEERENKGDSNNESEGSEEELENEGRSDWLSTQRPKLVKGKTLVVCPATLLGQWEGEVGKQVRRGTLDVLVHHGSNREKKARRLAKPDIVITTYNIVSRDGEQTQSPLFQIRWERVILDEAHQIRNYKTKTAQMVFKLKAKKRWALTGTPVHNKEIDLYALLKFLRCAPFDDLAVWKRWVDNRDAAGVQRLNTITKSLMLRRTKKGLQEKGELLSLKDKSFNTIFIVLDCEEQAAYEKLLNFSKTLFCQFLHQKAEKENALSGVPIPSKASHYLKNAENPFEKHPDLARLHNQMRNMSDIKSHHILVLLLRLRQFCCHPSLINSMLDEGDVTNVGIEDHDGLDIDLMDKLTRLSLAPVEDEKNNETDMTALTSGNPLFAPDRLSSKMRKILEVLDVVLNSEDKVILVSQWVSLLNIIREVLKTRKIKCVSLTGQVPVKDRPAIVEKFNRKGHSPRVMLLSLTAGGVGLNLVGGNHLFLLDLHWNPQLESQACDRIYRVGQEKDVQIYKFVSSETIEESVMKLQEKKLEIAKDVLTGAKHTSKLSLDDLKMLFNVK